nr:hypothetical protein [Sicyoidochytrium minutum DNA virus]
MLIAIGGVIAGISVVIWAAVSEGGKDDSPTPTPSPSPGPGPGPSPGPAPAPEPDSGGISSGALIGAIIASVIAAIILFVVAIFAVGRNKPMAAPLVQPENPDQDVRSDVSEESEASFEFDDR